MVLGVQPLVPGNNPGQEKPWQAAKALAPVEWAHKLVLPYPTSAQQSVSHLLSGHMHALKDLLSLLVTHTCMHAIPHPPTSPSPAPFLIH